MGLLPASKVENSLFFLFSWGTNTVQDAWHCSTHPAAILESQRLSCLFGNLKRVGDFLQLFLSEYNSSKQLITAKEQKNLIFCFVVFACLFFSLNIGNSWWPRKALRLPTARLCWTHWGRSWGCHEFQCRRGDVYTRQTEGLAPEFPS